MKKKNKIEDVLLIILNTLLGLLYLLFGVSFYISSVKNPLMWGSVVIIGVAVTIGGQIHLIKRYRK